MHWYDWHTVTERLQGRAYALTMGRPYKVVLDPNTPTGCCDFTSKQILINPNLFSNALQEMGLTGTRLDKANFLVSRAITGHEALHVIYSDPAVVTEAAKESALLKTVLNLLEDARIERMGSETSRVSKTLFGFVNGIARTRLPEFRDTTLGDKLSILHLLLRWRLGGQIPALDAGAIEQWKRVQAVAEKSLQAEDCRQVLNLAREILRVTGLGESSYTDSDLPDDVRDTVRRMQSEIMGERQSPACPNPGSQAPQPGGPLDTDHETEQTDEPNQAVDGEENAHSSRRSSLTEDLEDTADDRDKITEHEVGDEPGNSKSSALNTEQVRISTEETEGTDYEKLVEEVEMRVSEDLDTLIPRESSEESSLLAKATSWRGRVYSDVVASPYAHYLPEAMPIAAELVRDLKAEGPKAVSGPSQYPGRFKARYYVRDRKKAFSAQRYQGLTVPKMALSLVIDRSGSMEHVVHELRTMSMAIALACEKLSVPLSIWALEGQVHIKRFDEHGPQILAKIAGVKTDTLTRVMPTINDATVDLRSRPEELKQIVLIHDGMPSDRTDFTNWRKGLNGIGVFGLFAMRPEDYQLYKDNPGSLRERMDELVGPKNYAIAPVTGIAKHWCSYIRNLRNRHSVLAG